MVGAVLGGVMLGTGLVAASFAMNKFEQLPVDRAWVDRHLEVPFLLSENCEVSGTHDLDTGRVQLQITNPQAAGMTSLDEVRDESVRLGYSVAEEKPSRLLMTHPAHGRLEVHSAGRLTRVRITP